jgi:hypothetical protein
MSFCLSVGVECVQASEVRATPAGKSRTILSAASDAAANRGPTRRCRGKGIKRVV